MELKTVRMQIPEGANLILGQSHFIKTVEDLYEIIVGTVPQMKFGIAFNEASMARLVRFGWRRIPRRATSEPSSSVFTPIVCASSSAK